MSFQFIGFIKLPKQNLRNSTQLLRSKESFNAMLRLIWWELLMITSQRAIWDSRQKGWLKR